MVPQTTAHNPSPEPDPTPDEIRGALADAKKISGNMEGGLCLTMPDGNVCQAKVWTDEGKYSITIYIDNNTNKSTEFDFHFGKGETPPTSVEVPNYETGAIDSRSLEQSGCPYTWQQIIRAGRIAQGPEVSGLVSIDASRLINAYREGLAIKPGVSELIKQTLRPSIGLAEHEDPEELEKTEFELSMDPDLSRVKSLLKEVADIRKVEVAFNQAFHPEQREPDANCSIKWGEACDALGLDQSLFRIGDKSVFPLGEDLPSDLKFLLNDLEVTPITEITWKDIEWIVVGVYSNDLLFSVRIGAKLDLSKLAGIALVKKNDIDWDK